ncbi:MAG: isoprenyl transferase [Rhodospirillales bacterium]
MPGASVPLPVSAGPPESPRHVAVIMDGNGRWAKSRGLPRLEGHRQGAESVRRCIEAAIDHGVEYLTLFGFSSENWKRSEAEVNGLMSLLRLYLRREIAELDKNGVRFIVIGDRSRLEPDINKMIADAEQRTAGNTRMTLVLALSYGARDELVRAARVLARAVAAGEMTADDIDEPTISRYLYTADIPDPDLLIRTSGEQRISNFLLWQCAYTEFVFTDTLWPDFDESDFAAAISTYKGRERRFGAAGV